MTQTDSYSNNPCQIVEFALTGNVTPTNMTLLPNAVTADAQPDDITLYVLHKAVDAVTMGTDFQIQASRFPGSWSPWETLAADYTEVADLGEYKLWRIDCDLSGTSAGTSMRWQIKTYNSKSQRLRGVLAAWG